MQVERRRRRAEAVASAPGPSGAPARRGWSSVSRIDRQPRQRARLEDRDQLLERSRRSDTATMSARGTLTSSTRSRRMLRRLTSISRAPARGAVVGVGSLERRRRPRRRRGGTGARRRTVWRDCPGLRLRTARPGRRLPVRCLAHRLLSGCRAPGALLARIWVRHAHACKDFRLERLHRLGLGVVRVVVPSRCSTPCTTRCAAWSASGMPAASASRGAGLVGEREVAEEERPLPRQARRLLGHRAGEGRPAQHVGRPRPCRGTRRSAPRSARRRRRAARSRAAPGRARPPPAPPAPPARRPPAMPAAVPARVLDHASRRAAQAIAARRGALS